MFQTQPKTGPARTGLARLTTLGVTATALLGLGVAPAAARPDIGPGVAVTAPLADTVPAGLERAAGGDDRECALQRVGQQFVKCDDLTGNGVPAPAWIPER